MYTMCVDRSLVVCGVQNVMDVFQNAQVKEYKADLVSLKEQLKQAAAGASEGDAARAELGLGDNYYSTSGGAGATICAEQLCTLCAVFMTHMGRNRHQSCHAPGGSQPVQVILFWAAHHGTAGHPLVVRMQSG